MHHHKCTLEDEKAASVAKVTQSKTSFAGFTEHFDSEELSKMRVIGTTESEDSTFVLSSIKNLYKNQLEEVSTKSVSGRSRGSNSKQKMTPEKLKILNDIFDERLGLFSSLQTATDTSILQCFNVLAVKIM